MKKQNKNVGFRFSTIEQLALYQMFHQSKRNKILHYLALPFIIYSGFILLGFFKIPNEVFQTKGVTPILSLNLGIIILAIALFSYLRLDFLTTIILAGWTTLLWIFANLTIHELSFFYSIGIIIICQLIGWYLAVNIGHSRIESKIMYNHNPVSSNIYFQKGMFLLQNVGKKPTLIDSWTQFIIGPFHLTLETLFALGYKRKLRNKINEQMRNNLVHFSKGKNIYN